MTEFPPTDDTVELVHPVVGKNVPIYCTCRLPNNNAAYVKCCGCCEWYHPDFANIPESAFHPTTKWLCFICPVNGKPFSSQVTLAARLETTLHWNLTQLSSLTTICELPLILVTLGGPVLVGSQTVGSIVPFLQQRFKKPARLCLCKEKVSEKKKKDMGKHQSIN